MTNFAFLDVVLENTSYNTIIILPCHVCRECQFNWNQVLTH